MNFRGKFLLNYGNNERFYDIAKQYKAHWGEKLFILDESLAQRFKDASRENLIQQMIKKNIKKGLF